MDHTLQFMKDMRLAPGVVLVAHDVGEDSGKINAARWGARLLVSRMHGMWCWKWNVPGGMASSCMGRQCCYWLNVGPVPRKKR